MPTPDVSTVDAFRQALLGARSLYIEPEVTSVLKAKGLERARQ